MNKQHDVTINLSSIRMPDLGDVEATIVKHPARPYLVLGKWDDNKYLVAPFSNELTPLSRGEMATGLEAPFAVIEAWNVQTVPKEVLARGWETKRVDDSIRLDAYDLFRNLMTGTPLMSGFKRAIGPKILSKEEPGFIHQVADRDVLNKQWSLLANLTVNDILRNIESHGFDNERIIKIYQSSIKVITEWLSYHQVTL